MTWCVRRRAHTQRHNNISRKKQALSQADCRITPGTRELHGPASHWPLLGSVICDLHEGLHTGPFEQTSPITWQP